jgi:phytoene synthase
MSSSAELAACRASLKGGSRSFHVASALLPRRVREPAAVLYAFCREADDLIDQGGGAGAVVALQQRLADLAAGGTDQPLPACDALLADVLAEHQVPPAVLAGLLEGFAWDVEGRQYRDIDALLAYAMRVAGTVGLAMALVMGVRGKRALLAATALGVAMQLTNICRDVGEDARLGRIYLPLAWLEDAGIDPEAWLTAPQHSPALAAVVERLLDLADAFYALGDAGLDTLPGDCRTGIRAARRLYAEIGHSLRRRGCNPLAGRTVVGPWRKLSCLLAPVRSGGIGAPVGMPDPEVERAFEAAAMDFLEAFPTALLNPTAPQHAAGTVVWVLDLFERLERRSMALQSGAADLQA